MNEKVEVLVKDKTGFADIECRVTLGVADEEVSTKSEGEGVESEKIVPNAPSSIYKARYYFEGALDEEELRDVIEANTDGDKLTGSDPTFHIRVSTLPVHNHTPYPPPHLLLIRQISYDNFEQAIKSRELELEQIDNEIGAVKAQIKEAQKGATATSSTSEPTKPAAAKSTAKKTAGKEKKEKSEKKKVKKTARVVEEDDSDLPPLQPAEPSKSWSEAIADSAATGVQLAVQHRAGIFFAAASVAIFFFGDLASV